MRPIPGATLAAQHHAADESATLRPPRPTDPLSCRLVHEADVGAPESPPEESQSSSSRSHGSRKRALSGASPSAIEPTAVSPGDVESAQPASSLAEGHTVESSSLLEGSSWSDAGAVSSIVMPSADEVMSLPMTPTYFGVSGPSSALSAGSSRRNSLTCLSLGYPESQFPADDAGRDDIERQALDAGTATSHFIMPTLTIPTRRPFTSEGKAMGKLKVLVAGDSGLGKTSLITAIVKSCEHIVHADPVAPAQSDPSGRVAPHISNGSSVDTTVGSLPARITEIYASTKPYPPWWAELEQSSLARRRKSVEGVVLDRNLCFVDTPGYRSHSTASHIIGHVVNYIESHMRKYAAHRLSESDHVDLLGGDGGSLVDLVFYFLPSTGTRHVDIEYLRRLSPLTNVIPLIARADLLTADQLLDAKRRISRELSDANICPFSFSGASEPGNAEARTAVHGVSSLVGTDHDVMDASLLMNSAYIQPLVQTDLEPLLRRVFCQDGSSWLRRSAAKKYVQWWQRQGRAGSDLVRHGQLSVQLASARRLHAGPSPGAALIHLSEFTEREEQLARVRLASWAADLQRSMANERLRYEMMARTGRMERLSMHFAEESTFGALVKVESRSRSRSPMAWVEDARRRGHLGGRLNGALPCEQDPLGLLQLFKHLRGIAWVAVELLGSLGLLGGLTVWASRHGWHGGLIT